MGLMFILSNTALKDKTDKELIFTYKVVGFAEGTWDFDNVFPVLNNLLPEILVMRATKDLMLTKEQTSMIKDTCKKSLVSLIKDKPEYSDQEKGDIKKILGKNIRIHLKDSHDKVIDTFFKIYQLADECIRDEKPMFFSVIENY